MIFELEKILFYRHEIALLLLDILKKNEVKWKFYPARNPFYCTCGLNVYTSINAGHTHTANYLEEVVVNSIKKCEEDL